MRLHVETDPKTTFNSPLGLAMINWRAPLLPLIVSARARSLVRTRYVFLLIGPLHHHPDRFSLVVPWVCSNDHYYIRALSVSLRVLPVSYNSLIWNNYTVLSHKLSGFEICPKMKLYTICFAIMTSLMGGDLSWTSWSHNLNSRGIRG